MNTATIEKQRAALIRQIRTAFADVTRLGGVSLHEADVIDDYGSRRQRKAARELDKDHAWWEVPDADMERYHWILSFLDATGFRYYIPAYMSWILKNYDRNDSASVDFTLYALDCGESLNDRRRQYFRLFNREQSTAVCAFLRFMAGDTAGMADCDAAYGALKRYWGEFC